LEKWLLRQRVSLTYNSTFKETLAGWAKGVIVGRARIGGIPIGVIVTESRATEKFECADPSDETSHVSTATQAGQVWFPNSAFKTAQAIRDFNNGEQLPLIIMANWRGFAGGQRDMSQEILKFGAQIVDALVDYKQPIFVYVIGELRGIPFFDDRWCMGSFRQNNQPGYDGNVCSGRR
jgi:acetyl-CoA carboxylase / biotin carboxylase 1